MLFKVVMSVMFFRAFTRYSRVCSIARGKSTRRVCLSLFLLVKILIVLSYSVILRCVLVVNFIFFFIVLYCVFVYL